MAYKNKEDEVAYRKAYFLRNFQDPAYKARRREWQKNWRAGNLHRYAQISYRFATLKRKCNYRGIEMELSIEKFRELVENKPCTYCGASTVSFGAGLDRVDSTKGYVLGNCVPCCYLCNVMKSDMTLETFYEQIERIADFRKR